MPYSLLWRAIEYDIIPKSQEHDISIACYSTMAQGLLNCRDTTADDVADHSRVT